ncbi:MAG: hypothetical protein JNM28_02260 [Armatimonadetes bacterium]|nr:hypothetical protein [Armatimonadota bacterium]
MVSILLATLLGGLQDPPITQAADWRVTPERCFEVGGEPYIPVGVKVEPTIESIDAAAKAGIQDVYVELPLDLGTWRRIVPELEARHLRYLIGISTLAPSASVVAVEPTSYRVSGLSGQIDINIDIPGGQRAYCLLANESNGGVSYEGTQLITGGKLRFRYRLATDLPHVLVIYPEVNDQRMPDFWEGFDKYRDDLLAVLHNSTLGPGYRGLVNPAGQRLTGFQADDTLVPTSKLFRLEFESFLRQKYGTPQVVAATWQLAYSGEMSLADYAATVPLWQGGRGVDSVWNLSTDRVSSASRRDIVWEDIRTVIRGSATRRINRLIDTIKEETHRPVIQTWNGWGGVYEDKGSSLDGIAFGGEPESVIDLMEVSSRPMSSALRRVHPMAALAIGLKLPKGENGFDATRAIRQTEPLGTRGWFFTADSAEDLAGVAAAAEIYRDQPSLARNAVQAVFFPEAATNPAVTSRLPGGYVWLPTPGSGERLDIGPNLEGYRYVNRGVTTFVFWAVAKQQHLKMRLSSEVVPSMRALDGTPLNIKQRRNEIEMDVPTSPVVVEGSADMPVPVEAFAATQLACAYLIDTFGKLVDLSGTEYLNLQRAGGSFDRSPLGSYLAVREQFRRMAILASPYNWLEAESPERTNFSGIAEISGCSSGKVLSLSPKIRSVVPYTAQYTVRNRLGDTHSVWIAARLDDVARRALKVTVAGQELTLQPHPVSYYGAGFGWYKCGEIQLPAGQTQMFLRAQADEPIDCQIDLLMVAPEDFRPNGPNPPTDWVWAALQQARPPAKTG